MRLVLLFGALGAAYALTRRPGGRAAALGFGAALLALASTLLVVLALQMLLYEEAGRLPRLDAAGIAAMLRLLGVDAVVGGAVIGYVLADQRNGAELAAVRAAGLAAATAGEAPKPSGIAPVIERLAKDIAGNLALVVLTLAIVVPHTAWRDIFGRVEGVEAAGLKIALGTGGTGEVAQSLRGNARPGDVTTPHEPNTEIRGFSTSRLEKLASLTFPPRPSAAPPDALERDPAALMLLRIGAEADRHYRQPLRQPQRDRGYTLLLAWGAEAAAGASPPAGVTDLAPRVAGFGAAQERMLVLLGAHVECIAYYARATRDRRILQYQALGVVPLLTAFARDWSRLERDLLTEALGEDALLARIADLAVPGARLATVLDSFGDWMAGAIDAWDRRPAEPMPAACGAYVAPAWNAAMRSITPETMRAGGFTPYLTLIAATALSAVGDHKAAEHLLATWLDDRQAVASRLGEAGTPQGPMRRALLASLDWFRLQAATEIIVLQSLAATAGENALVSEPLLRDLVRDRFPAALRTLGATESLEGWRLGGGRSCHGPTQRWRQPLLLSYLTHATEYLNLRTGRLVDPRDIEDEDVALATRLADMDAECFAEVDPVAVWRRARWATFLIASASFRMNLLGDADRLARSERERLAAELDALLRRAIVYLREAEASEERSDQCAAGSCDAALRRALAPQGVARDLRNAEKLRSLLAELRRRMTANPP